jgi:hypothetical protein
MINLLTRNQMMISKRNLLINQFPKFQVHLDLTRKEKIIPVDLLKVLLTKMTKKEEKRINDLLKNDFILIFI